MINTKYCRICCDSKGEILTDICKCNESVHLLCLLNEITNKKISKCYICRARYQLYATQTYNTYNQGFIIANKPNGCMKKGYTRIEPEDNYFPLTQSIGAHEYLFRYNLALIQATWIFINISGYILVLDTTLDRAIINGEVCYAINYTTNNLDLIRFINCPFFFYISNNKLYILKLFEYTIQKNIPEVLLFNKENKDINKYFAITLLEGYLRNKYKLKKKFFNNINENDLTNKSCFLLYSQLILLSQDMINSCITSNGIQDLYNKYYIIRNYLQEIIRKSNLIKLITN